MKFKVIVEIEDPPLPKRSWLNPFKDMEFKDDQWVEKQELKVKRLAKIEREGISRLNRILSNEGVAVHQIEIYNTDG
ncbi:hypothetical protein M1N93_00010 [Dehalococcoidia bacterium]|nr:hypothetical protein [Dehalococcoidia bacterium]